MLLSIDEKEISFVEGGTIRLIAVGFVAPVLAYVGYYLAEYMRPVKKKEQDEMCNK